MRQKQLILNKKRSDSSIPFENLLSTFFTDNLSNQFIESLKKRFKEIPGQGIIEKILIREEPRYDEGIVLLCKMYFSYTINNNKHKFEIHCHYTRTGEGVVSQHTTRWMNYAQSSESQFKKLFI